MLACRFLFLPHLRLLSVCLYHCIDFINSMDLFHLQVFLSERVQNIMSQIALHTYYLNYAHKFAQLCSMLEQFLKSAAGKPKDSIVGFRICSHTQNGRKIAWFWIRWGTRYYCQHCTVYRTPTIELHSFGFPAAH